MVRHNGDFFFYKKKKKKKNNKKEMMAKVCLYSVSIPRPESNGRDLALCTQWKPKKIPSFV